MRKHILFVFLLFSSFLVYAQVPKAIELDFSSPQERGKWKMESTGSTKWVIGEDPDYAYGDNWMIYTSTDVGKSRNYSADYTKCMAYYPLGVLPKGKYTLSFRFRGLTPEDNNSNLTAYIYPRIDAEPVLSNTFSYHLESGSACYYGNRHYQGKWWRTGKYTFISDGTTELYVSLYFINKSGMVVTRYPHYGYAIDAIQIYPISDDPFCAQIPRDLAMHREGNDAVLTWAGNASEYQLQYFMNDTTDNTRYTVDNITTLTHRLHSELIPEGAYTFRVRSICGKDTSGWAAIDYQLVYDISKHCLDYLNFYDPAVKTQQGSFNNPYSYSGPTNEGFMSEESRHTEHHYPRDFDENTENRLRTFPKGQPAAVRLGNWQTGAQAEAVVYTLDVTEDMSLLQFRYALVMQLPGHKPSQQPRFTLEFLDTDGTLIDSCGFADFTASANLDGWHTVHREGETDIIWKNWTLVAMTMSDYIGRTVQIRITVKDCAESKHFGYAYFTMSCMPNKMLGVHCGEKPDSFTVEDGFRYRWYRKYDDPRVILGTDRTYHLEKSIDTATYCVDLINKVNDSCYFTLEASSLAYVPHSAGGVKYTPKNCENYVQLVDSSTTQGVYWREDGKKVVVKSIPGTEEVVWEIANYGTYVGHTHTLRVPDNGDTLHVTLRTYMENRRCEDSLFFDYVVPPAGPVVVGDTLYFCKGGSRIYRDKVYTEETEFADTLIASFGCDSINVLALRYFKEDTIVVDGAICIGGDPFEWEGQTYTQPGDYFVTVKSRIYDCDSVHNVLHLHNQYPLDISVSYIAQTICDGKGVLDVPFNLTAGNATHYDLIFPIEAQQDGFANRYGVPVAEGESQVLIPIENYAAEGAYRATIVFHNFTCDSVAVPLDFVVSYGSEQMINQRWNDFLSVSKKAYDKYGGFTDYRWYKDNVPLTGETGSQLYLPEEGLDGSSGYSVEMTRLSDGVRFRTCPYYPVPQPNTVTLSVYPTVVSASDHAPLRIRVSEPAGAQLYYQTGMHIATWQLREGENTYRMPSLRGLYLLRVQTASGEGKTRKIIVR